MDKKLWYELSANMFCIFATFFLLNRRMYVLGTLLLVITIASTLYTIYKIYSKKENNTMAACAIAIIALLAIAGIFMTNPDIQKDIDNGNAITGSNNATITVYVKNPNMFVEKTYILFENNIPIDQFKLGAGESKEIKLHKTWNRIELTKTITYKIQSWELYNIITHEEQMTVTLVNGSNRVIDLST